MDAYFLASEWKQVLLWETKALGPNVIRESQGWQWLGEKLSTPAPAIFRVFASGKPEVRDAREAERCFRKAVEGDPGNEAAWLGLLDLLEGLKKDAARNRLLDDLVERFPANKSLAFRAGKLAMQRKAFGKATRFFEEVKRLDPLDRETDAWLAGALIARAREAFARKKSVPEIWERIESLADPSPSCADLRRARWVVHLQRALLDPGQTDTARAKAAALAPSPTRLLALEYLLSSAYRLEVPEEWYAKWECCLQCPWSELHELLGLVLHFAQTHSLQKHEADGPEYFIMQEAITAALVRGLIEADPPGAFAFSQNLRKRSPHESTRAENLREAILVQINRAAKNTAAVTRSKDPHLRYLALAAEKLHDLDIPSKSYLSKVRQLISDAEAAGIAQLAAAARLLIREDSNTFDEDAFDEDWEDDDEAGFSSAQAISNLFKRIAKKTAAKKTKAKKTPSSKPAPSRAPGPESEPNETQPDLDLFSPRPSP
jgi:tetratricopeptide (TPR) repeat protein